MPAAVASEVFADLNTLGDTKLSFAQTAGGQGCVETEVGCNDLSGLLSAHQRAGVDSSVITAGECFRCKECIGETGVIQRDIGGSLNASRQIPIGLPMAHERDEGHAPSLRDLICHTVRCCGRACPGTHLREWSHARDICRGRL